MPDMTRRQDCQRLVNMIDFYPTLIDLCGLPEKPVLDGLSFSPLLKNPNMAWDSPAVTVHGHGNASARDGRWRFIRYSDGTEELYDLQADPQEWHNLITRPSAAGRVAMRRLGDLLPKEFAEPIAYSKGKFKKAKYLNTTIKATRTLSKLK